MRSLLSKMFAGIVFGMSWIDGKLSKVPVVHQIWWLFSLPIAILLFLIYMSPLNTPKGHRD